MDENEDLRAALAGRYEIIREIGRGGMAVVYLAHDIKHSRSVALKVLATELASSLGPERFLREIAITAPLVHPNILPLYDSGEAAGFLYYVMPYVDGPTLGQRLKREVQLPLDDVLAIARQVAPALDYAHARGVIHRDIKPDNILLSGEHVLVGDFGLARAISSAASTPLTDVRFVVGTVPYMSPEQCTPGRAVDGRSDIYSFGCVVFEMITGVLPFRGATADATMSHHLTSDPPSLRSERRSCPSTLDDAVRRALAKAPADRFRTAGEFFAALNHTSVRNANLGAGEEKITPSSWWRASPLPIGWRQFGVVAAVLGVAAIAVLAGMALTPRNDVPQVVTFSVPPPTGTQFSDDLRDVSAVSPDGRDIVFVGTDSAGTRSLWLRPLASAAARRIDGTESGQKAFWSPDGKHLGFFTSRALALIGRDGGVARTLDATFTDQRGGSWADNGTIVYAPGSQTGIFLLSLSDSTTRQITRPDASRGEIGHLWPHALPGGRQFLYFVASELDSVRGIYLGSVEKGRGRRVVESSASGTYSRGHLLFVHAGALVAQRLDRSSAALVGERRVIADSIATSFGYYGAFSASETGVLVYAGGRSRDLPRLAWLDSAGVVRGYVSEPGYVRNPDLSDDGRSIASETYRETNSDIGYVDVTSGVSNVVADGGTQSMFPVWSPDASTLAFIAERPSEWSVYLKNVTRSDPAMFVWRMPRHAVLSDWAAGGKLILAERNVAGDWDLVMRELSAPAAAVMLAGGPAHQLSGRVSPNGRYLAYTSLESGTGQVYVQRFPSTGARCQVSSAGGWQPVWGPNPGDLFFLSNNGTLMRAQLDLRRPVPCLSAPARSMFRTPIRSPATARSHFDVSQVDGRFLFRLPSGDEGSAWLHVVMNWLAATRSPP